MADCKQTNDKLWTIFTFLAEVYIPNNRSRRLMSSTRMGSYLYTVYSTACVQFSRISVSKVVSTYFVATYLTLALSSQWETTCLFFLTDSQEASWIWIVMITHIRNCKHIANRCFHMSAYSPRWCHIQRVEHCPGGACWCTGAALK